MKAMSTAASITRHALGAAFEAVLLVAIVAALTFGIALAIGDPVGAGSVFAAKGGNGNGHGSGGVAATSAWVSVSPTVAGAWGTRVDVNGCGYRFAPVEVHVVHSAGGAAVFTVGVWNTGCMAGTYFTTKEPGTYTVEVYQASGSNGQTAIALMASTVVAVQ